MGASIIIDYSHKGGLIPAVADSTDNQVVKDIVRGYFAPFGRKGGLSKSPRKLAAVKANLAKARANRRPKAKASEVAG